MSFLKKVVGCKVVTGVERFQAHQKQADHVRRIKKAIIDHDCDVGKKNFLVCSGLQGVCDYVVEEADLCLIEEIFFISCFTK